MNASAYQFHASGAYRRVQHESRAAAADRVELVAMLYDELETALGVLMALMERRQPVATSEPARRARMILIALESGLDHEAGGDLATTLAKIYASMRLRLDHALNEGNTAMVQEICDGVQALGSAWRQLRPAAE